MKTEDFRKIFMKKKLLLPKTSDLSFFNWDSATTHLNDSANFRSDPSAKLGLQFRNAICHRLLLRSNFRSGLLPGPTISLASIEMRFSKFGSWHIILVVIGGAENSGVW